MSNGGSPIESLFMRRGRFCLRHPAWNTLAVAGLVFARVVTSGAEIGVAIIAAALISGFFWIAIGRAEARRPA